MSLIVKNLKKAYGTRTVLDIEELELEEGKIYAVLGPNGSGKSTLLQILAGLCTADCGHVYFNEREGLLVEERVFLPQNPYLFDFTVVENVQLGLKEGNRKQRALEALRLVGMESFSNARPSSLSGGEAQRVAVARALLPGRKWVLLDEPASYTDIASMRQVEEYMQAVNEKKGSGMLFTTHNPSQALRIADEMLFLWQGKIVEKGEPAALIHSPSHGEFREFMENWRI